MKSGEKSRKMEKKYLKNYIKKSDYLLWKKGDNILIDAQTGIGKSHFVFNELVSYCQRQGYLMLVLSNRKLLKWQNTKMASSEITCYNYQFLEKMEDSKMLSVLSKYDIIVFDECHYFFKDSVFNMNTDKVLDYALAESNQIKIFTSSTPEPLLYSGIVFAHEYIIPRDYKYIKQIIFFKDINDVMKILMQEKKKSFVIVGEPSIGFIFQNNYRRKISFICSENNDFYIGVDKNVIKRLVEKHDFAKKILMTTTVLDNGFSLKDSEIRNVAIDFSDKITIVQGVGRKRIEGKEKITLYLQLPSYKLINSMVYKKMSSPRRSATLYYQYLKDYYKEILKVGYIQYWLKYFGVKKYKVIDSAQEAFTKFLAENVNKVVTRVQVYEAFKKIKKIKNENARPITYNNILKEMKLPYRIVSLLVRNKATTQRVWKVISKDLTDK